MRRAVIPAVLILSALSSAHPALAQPAGANAETPATAVSAVGSGTETAAPAAAPALPADPVADAITRRLADPAFKNARADREDRVALIAYYEARAGKPLWAGEAGLKPAAIAAAREIRKADDWGLKADDFDPPATEVAATSADLADAELKLSLAVLKYARHARGGRMDPMQLSNYIDRQPPLLAPAAVLDGIAKADASDAYLRKLHPQHPQFEKLRQLYLAMKSGAVTAVAPPAEPAEEPGQGKSRKRKAAGAPEPAGNARKVLLNMEQWRWMPEDLGDLYVTVNIPEFTVRVVKNGQAIHSERVITGKPDNQTPIFSDEIETVVFHPFWGVPDSIKIKEILPGLIRGSSVLEKNGLRIQRGGRDIDPYAVDWFATDIRNFHVYQPPGGSNVLGVVKFLFPNKHQVYMHDTPTKNLFNAPQRTFSHGCMRVRNPLKLAEVLLNEDKGWKASNISALVNGGPQNNNVPIERKIGVHITYFTAFVDDEDKPQFRADVYGHEPRIQMGLDGKAHLIVKKKEDLGPVRAEVISRLAESRRNPAQNFFDSIFGKY